VDNLDEQNPRSGVEARVPRVMPQERAAETAATTPSIAGGMLLQFC